MAACVKYHHVSPSLRQCLDHGIGRYSYSTARLRQPTMNANKEDMQPLVIQDSPCVSMPHVERQPCNPAPRHHRIAWRYRA